LDRELQLHIDLETQKYLNRGLSRQDARTAALRDFGGLQRTREDCRSLRPGSSIEALLRDFRYSLRALARTPGFTGVVVLSLAIGIGSSSAVFSVVSSLLLHPYNFPSLDRLVLVKETSPGGGPADSPLAPADFLDLRAETGTFKDIAAFRFRAFNMTGAGEPEAVEGFLVSPNFFDVVGLGLAAGHGFTPDQDQEGKDRSVILRYGFWQQRFGGDPGILGRTISLDGNTFTVTGIMPEGFNYPLGGDLWVPLALTNQEKTDRTAQSLFVLGRLADGGSVSRSLALVQRLAGRLQEQYPNTNAGRNIGVQRLREEQYRYTAPLFLTLQGAALLVLLLAGANVTNLLLARVVGRQREIAIRRAMGSSRLSILRLFLTETMLLSLLAGSAAVLIAYWSSNLIRVAIPEGMSRWIAGWNDIRVDGRVLGFTLLVVCLVALLFGLAAAFQSSKFDLNRALKETTHTVGLFSARRRLRGSLVVAQMVLSLVLLVSAGLMIKGFFKQIEVFQGYQPAGILVLDLTLPPFRYKDAQIGTFFERAIAGMSAIPGVDSVATARNIPASNVGNITTFFTIEGRPVPAPTEYPAADSQVISDDFFATLRVPILEGRTFNKLDGNQAPRVAIISRSLSDRFWPGQHPIGSRIKFQAPESDSPWITIVGISGDIKQNWWDPAERPVLYLPSGQTPSRNSYILIRTSRDPLQFAAAARGIISGLDPDQPLGEIRTLEDEVRDSVAPLKIIGLLMVAFGGLALALSATGVFSVLAYGVAQRTYEFGLRMALGASPREVLASVQIETIKLAAIGLAIGLPASVAVGSAMSTVLVGVVTVDAGTFAVFASVLIAVSLLAGYFPARRAARLNPMLALRND
jgi:putative ABC transport system permease protein